MNTEALYKANSATATDTTSVDSCRACGGNKLAPILDLGVTPLANSLLTQEQLSEPEFVAPLKIVLCESCALLQITCLVPPERLFRNYAYFSSFSETMLKHAKDLVCEVIDRYKLTKNNLVVEIASNDGYLLKNYQAHGVQILGIEPAVNVAAIARQNGIETVAEFFDQNLAAQLVQQSGQADIIHAHNVLAHVPNINSILTGMRILLKDSGVAIVEVPYAIEMINHLEFDTIYHEHVFYFTATAINNLCRRNNLVLLDIETVKIHGGSLRLFIGKNGKPSAVVQAMLDYEHTCGFDTAEGYKNFTAGVVALKTDLRDLLLKLQGEGCSIAAYGAAAKGSTLLNFCGIDNTLIDFVVDRSTVKQGFYMPGVKLPIYAPTKLLEKKPDYVLLLTWNFADEILEQQIDYLRQGGKFIIPVPHPKIVAFDS